MIGVGDLVDLDCTISVHNSLTDATVVLTVGLPDGTTATPSVTHVGTGRYTCAYHPAQVGRYSWTYSWSGGAQGSRSGAFNVVSTSGAIMSLDEAKAHLNMPDDDDVDDDELAAHIETATRVVERHLAKVVVRRSVVETHAFNEYPLEQQPAMGTPSWGGLFVAGRRVVLDANPIISVTSVANNDLGISWDPSTQLDLDGDLGAITVRSGALFTGLVTFTVVAGMAVVPQHYVLAAQFIVAHLWESQRMATVRGGGAWRSDTDATPSGFGFAIPNRAVELLGGRPPVIA